MLVGFDFQRNILCGTRIDFYFCFYFFSNTLDVEDDNFIWGQLTTDESSVPCTNCILSEGLCIICLFMCINSVVSRVF